MRIYGLSRRQAAFGFAAIAAAALSACNAPQTVALQTQAAAPGIRIGTIQVDTAPLVPEVGDPTAAWAQQALPGQFARAFAAHMAPGDPSAATLAVRVSSLYLGGGGPADPDVMKGVVTLNGRSTSVRATSTYFPSPTDQALPEQALHGRVTALSQAFTDWAAHKVRL